MCQRNLGYNETVTRRVFAVKTFLVQVLICSLIFSLAGCTKNTPRQNAVIGTTVGAAAGTGLGAASGPAPGPITLLGTGAFVGALIGWSYGNYMESSDKEKAFAAIAAGKTATWKNAHTGVVFAIDPAPHCTTYDNNSSCRQFTATQTTTDGVTRKIFRTACKGARGTWALVR